MPNVPFWFSYDVVGPDIALTHQDLVTGQRVQVAVHDELAQGNRELPRDLSYTNGMVDRTE